MDKSKVRLWCLLYGIITPLLSHNGSLNHVSLALGTHIFRLGSSTDPVVHASKHSGLNQMWVEFLHFPQQNTSRNPFIYCEVEQELRCQESDEHPNYLDEKATGIGVTFGGYVKVQSAPYAYDQGAEAERDNPKSAPLLWFSHPPRWGVARNGSIIPGILHLFCGSVKTIDAAK